MRPFRFIDLPVRVDISKYDHAILHAAELLASFPEVKAVYQIGSVGTPGISDIDLVVVFHSGSSCSFNLQEHLDKTEKYLFIHRLYGISEDHIKDPFIVSFFPGFRLITGVSVLSDVRLTADDEKELKQQIAYEFLLRMWMVLNVQYTYRIIKVRSFLLEGHGLKYDLDFLNIRSGPLYDAVQQVISLRNGWFDNESRDKELINLFEKFRVEIEKLLASMNESSFFLPESKQYKLGNMTLRKSDGVSWKKSGLLIPRLGRDEKKQFNLLHRFHRFRFSIPFENKALTLAITKRFELVRELREYNERYLPNFIPLITSLKFNG